METNNKKQKIWGIVKKVAFALLTGFLIYLLCAIIPVICYEYGRMAARIPTRSQENAEFFWFDCCCETIIVMLAAVCIVKLIRMLRNKNDVPPLFSAGTRKALFLAALVLLAGFLVGCRISRRIWDAAFTEVDLYISETSRYYLFVIAVELDLGFLLWLFADWRREKKQEKKSLAEEKQNESSARK